MKKLVPAAIAAATVALTLAFASPAMAIVVPDPSPVAPLPAGQSLYAINCSGVYPDFQLLGVDPTSAVSTPIGTGTGVLGRDCAFQPAFDAVHNIAYYVQELADSSMLAKIDLTTGVTTVVGEFTENIQSIAIAPDGVTAYAFANNELYSLDLTNAALDYIGDTDISAYGAAVDPISGDLYALEPNGDLWTVDVTDASLTAAGLIYNADTSFGFFSLQIDSAGTFWVELDSRDGESDDTLANLYNFAKPDADTVVNPAFVGTFTDDPYYTEAILIATTPAVPALAKTGTDLTGVPLVAGFAALLVAGGALVLARRRRTV